MEQLGWRRYLVMAAMTLAAVLFCIGGASIDAHAATRYVMLCGEKYEKSFQQEFTRDEINGYIEFDKDKNTLLLKNVKIHTTTQALGIYICGGNLISEDKFTITLEGTNVIYLDATSLVQYHTCGLDAFNIGCTYINGPGTLSVQTNGDYGIIADNSLVFGPGVKVTVAGTSGELEAYPNCGIRAKGYITLESGSEVVTTGYYYGLKNADEAGDSTYKIRVHGAGTALTATAWDDEGVGIHALYKDYGLFKNNYDGACLEVDELATVKATGGANGHAIWNDITKAQSKNYIAIRQDGQGALHKYIAAGSSATNNRTTYYNSAANIHLKDELYGKDVKDYQYIEIGNHDNVTPTVTIDFSRLGATERPAEIAVALQKDGQTKEQFTFKRDEMGSLVDWTHNFAEILAEPGYSLVVTGISDGYDTRVSGDLNRGFTVTVYKNQPGCVAAGVEVYRDIDEDADDPASVTLTLYKSGEQVGQPLTLGADCDWRGVFYDLVEADSALYELRVSGLPENYYATVEGSVANHEFKVTIRGGSAPASEAVNDAADAECHHVYEWEVYKAATATDDGEMRYRCKYCGDVQYSVPVTAYYTFNKETQEKVLKAEQGATVKVQTPWFISFHEMVYKALQERPDVTLVVDYKNEDALYEMTIPAGSGDQLQGLFGESQFAGFLYLGGTYATTELPKDTVFEGVSATEMWFGTTTAH